MRWLEIGIQRVSRKSDYDQSEVLNSAWIAGCWGTMNIISEFAAKVFCTNIILLAEEFLHMTLYLISTTSGECP
jgi:hypothetical protein